MLPTKFRYIWPNGLRGEESKKSANQKQELPVAAMFVNGSGRIKQSLQRTFHRCFLPRFGSFGQVFSEEKIFRNRPIRNKKCMWWPCLLMDRDKMINLQRTSHRCILPSFSTFGQAVSEEMILKNRPIRNKNCLRWPCLLTYRNEMSNCNRELSIDDSYQVSVHLAERFQRRRNFKISQSETRIACGGHVC